MPNIDELFKRRRCKGSSSSVSSGLVSPVQSQPSGSRGNDGPARDRALRTECEKRGNRFTRRAGGSWRADETNVKIKGRWLGASAQSDDYADKSRHKPLPIFEMRRAAPDSNVCDGTLAPPLPDTANPKTEQGCPTDDDHGETEVEP